MTLEATDTLVGDGGIVGWDFLDEAETANALVPILKDKYGADAIVVLLHEGGSQTPPPDSRASSSVPTRSGASFPSSTWCSTSAPTTCAET